MRTVAVVGGSGFIGRAVVGALRNADAVPVVVGKDDPADSDIEFHAADALDLRQMEAALYGCDAVVHLAARSGGIQMQNEAGVFDENRAMTDTVLEASRRAGVQAVFLASSQVVYRDSTEPIPEEAPIVSSWDQPSQYAWSKATDEVVGRWWGEASGIRLVIGRFGNIYGPGASYDDERSTVIHALVRRFGTAVPTDPVVVWGDGSAIRSFLFVDDAGRAVVDVLRGGESGSAYNIDSGEGITIADLASIVRDTVSERLAIAYDGSKPVGVPYRVGSVARLQALGWVPRVSLRDGIRTTLADYRRRFPSG
ncbi:MAG: NAD-dependent epimerase/dehydratase family protein [Acidimicrobiia bacterium]